MSAGAAKRCEKREYLKAARKLRSSEVPRGDLFRRLKRYEREAARKCCESANT